MSVKTYREDNMGNLNKKAALFALAYIVGTCIASVFYLLKVLRCIRVEHLERLPRWQRSMLILSNHRTPFEPFFIPSLFAREWVRSPIQWGPWSTPGRDKLKWDWLGEDMRNIAIPRKRKGGESREEFQEAIQDAFRRIKEVLREGGRIILFGEGTRLAKVPANQRLKSPKGNELRHLRHRVGDIILASLPTVLPIWVQYPERGWFPIKIKIGHSLIFSSDMTSQDVIEKLEDTLLVLADEGED